MERKKTAANKWHIRDAQHSNHCWRWLASLFVAVMLVGIVVACTEEPIQSMVKEEGLPATLRIDVNAHEPIASQTRAVNTMAIANLHILVYNNAGELIGKNYAVTTSSIVINTRSANNCTVYAIANTGNPNLFDGKVMKDIDLKLATASISSWDGLTNGTHLPMTGKIAGVTIAAGNPSSNKIGNLSVSRMVAQVTLDLTTDAADKIVIHNYRIYGLAKQAYYMDRPTESEGDPNDIENTAPGDDAAKPTTPGHWTSSPQVSVEASNKSVTFYMYENRRGVKTNITTQKDKIKVNAPDSATYVVINGETNGYKYTWRVYLGANNTNNFNIKRNCTYTYNIKLKSSGTDTRVTVTDMFEQLIGGNANCYMVKPGASVNIPVERANESPLELDESVYNPTTKTYYQLFYNTKWTAEIVWQTSPGLIRISNESGTGGAGSFTVNTSAVAGNALVAIKNNGNILWSWHIWVTDYNGITRFTTYNGKRNYNFMDRALGATSSIAGQLSSCGLMYQWGRKDPFPGVGQLGGSWTIANETDPIRVYNASGDLYEITKEPTPNVAPNNLTNATRNPDTFYFYTNVPYDWFVYNSSSAQNNNLWSGGDITLTTAMAKSVFDPCPMGWRTPPWLNNISPFAAMSSSGSWNNFGMKWGEEDGGYFPASGVRYPTTGKLVYISINGYNWTGSPDYTTNQCYSYSLFFNSTYNNTINGNTRACGIPVRCCLDNL